jgi:hypothetical protein
MRRCRRQDTGSSEFVPHDLFSRDQEGVAAVGITVASNDKRRRYRRMGGSSAQDLRQPTASADTTLFALVSSNWRCSAGIVKLPLRGPTITY